MKQKYFSIKSISVATYLGGPLAGGILISLNFKRFQQKDKAFWSLIISFLATVILMWTILQVPERLMEKIPNFLLPLLYTPIIVFITEKLQKHEIQKLEEQEVEKEHWWKAAGLGLVGTALTFAVIFQLASSEPPFQGERFLYGELKHEIYYQGKGIDEEFLNKLAIDFEKIGYFSNEYPQTAHVEEWNTRYIFSIFVDEAYWEDKEVLELLGQLKKQLELNLSKEVTIKMLHPTWMEIKEKRI